MSLMDDELTDEDLAALEGSLAEEPVSVADTPQEAPDVPEPKDNGARPAFAPPAVAPAKQAPAFNEDDAEVQGLKAAIVEKGRRQLSAGIGEAADAFSSALLKQKPATDYWQGRMAMAEAPVKEFGALQGLRAQQQAAKLKAQAQQTAYTNALTAKQNADSSAEGKRLYAEALRIKTEAAQRKMATDEALGKADSPETQQRKQWMEIYQPNIVASYKALGKWDTITGAELPDMAEGGKTYRAERAAELQGDRQGVAMSEAERVRQEAIRQEAIRNERERLEKIEEEKRRAAAEAEAEKAKAAAKRVEDEKKLYIPGLSREGAKGTITVDEAEKLRGSLAESATIDKTLGDLADVRKSSWAWERKWGPETAAKMDNFQTALIGSINQLYHFGALDAATQVLLTKMVPGREDFTDGTFQGKLESLKQIIKNRIDAQKAKLEYHDEAARGGPRTPSGQPYKTKAKAKDGSIHYFDEQGKEVR